LCKEHRFTINLFIVWQGRFSDKGVWRSVSAKYQKARNKQKITSFSN